MTADRNAYAGTWGILARVRTLLLTFPVAHSCRTLHSYLIQLLLNARC